MQLRNYYNKTVAEKLQKDLKLDSSFEVPKLEKIILNIGVSDPQDPRQRKRVIDNMVEQFEVISGQKPMITVAKKSIAGFKLRAGDPLGVKVTLRGNRMWGFMEKLIAVALPRVKDFRGIPKTAFDGQGNYALGIEEQIVFPEIEYDKIEGIRSLQAIIVTSTKKDEEAFKLLEALGMPFEKED